MVIKKVDEIKEAESIKTAADNFVKLEDKFILASKFLDDYLRSDSVDMDKRATVCVKLMGLYCKYAFNESFNLIFKDESNPDDRINDFFNRLHEEAKRTIEAQI